MIPELCASYSTICSQDLIEKILPDYCIDSPSECFFWERGTNDTYQVRCANARYSLRVYRHNIYPRDEIDFEVDALNYLHKNGFSVAYPVARKSGSYVTEIAAPEGLRYVLLTAFVDGREPEYESLDDYHLTGESVAQLHEVSQGFTTPHKKKNLDLKNFIDDSLVIIEPYLTNHSNELEALRQYAAKIKTDVQQAGEDSLDWGFCHGDLHGSNAHLHNGVLAHFDFEECGYGYRVYDLATFKWGFFNDNSADEKWQAFVNGYQSVRKIGEADLQVLPSFLLLRQIWLIAFHMRNVHDFGSELTSDEYIHRQWKRLEGLCCTTGM